MKRDTITLVRHDGYDWIFTYDNTYNAFIYHGENNVYRLFFSDPSVNYKPFWIGIKHFTNNVWLSVEHEIHAYYIDFLGSRLIFK